MKKLLLATILTGCGIGLMAQPVSRKVLVEEATNASCGPCASQNPAFNTNIIQPNLGTKLVSVKYQAWWPGADPMYDQNSTELDTRINYYGFGSIGVPTSALNGRIPDANNTTGGAWTGYAGGPYGYTQTVIDNEYADLTPFSMTLSHTISTDLDSVYVTVTMTNVDVATFTGSDMKLHIALLEDVIEFSSAPGSNGETEFHEVMRKMIPDASGTSISNTWTASQTQTLTIGAPIPSYVYELTEISIAAWVQDNTSKEVWQAERSAPVQIDGPDLALNSLDVGFGDYCAASVNPQITIENAGTEVITTAALEVTINGATVTTENWTGNLAVGATSAYTFTNAVTRTAGTNDMEIRVMTVNGGADISNSNNTLYENVSMVANTPMDYPTSIGFEGLSFGEFGSMAHGVNPVGMTFGPISSGDVNGVSTPLGGFAASEISVFWSFYTAGAGQSANFVTDELDIVDAEEASLSFSHAYVQYTTENDRLEVLVSTDCGVNWATIFDEAGTSLSTASASTAAFFPTSGQWDSTSLSLNDYVGNEVMFMFRGTSAYGNNLFVDDINLSAAAPSDTNDVIIDGQVVYIINGDTFEIFNGEYVPLGVTSAAEAAIAVYPNPASDVLNITGINGLATAKVFDMSGRLVMNVAIESNSIDVSTLKAGMYQVSIDTEALSVMRRITVTR